MTVKFLEHIHETNKYSKNRVLSVVECTEGYNTAAAAVVRLHVCRIICTATLCTTLDICEP